MWEHSRVFSLHFKSWISFKSCGGTSLAVQWLRLQASTVGDPSLIPGSGGTKIPHAVRCGQKNKKSCYPEPLIYVRLHFFLSLYWICYSTFCFLFLFLGHKACGILASWSGIKPSSSVLEGKVLTTRPPSILVLDTLWILTLYNAFSTMIVSSRIV